MGRRAERGSALIIALVMVMMVGLLASSALTYGTTSLRASTTAIAPDRDATYAAGGAIDLATQYLDANATVGVAGGSTCGDSSTFNSVVALPASGNAPAVDVKCQPTPTSGTVAGGGGGVTDTTPAYGILALGTRNYEPGPLNNFPLDATSVGDTNQWGERGIDLQKSSTAGNAAVKFGANIYSNAPIRRGANWGAATLTSTGTFSASGACENVTPCTVVPYSGSSAKPDPGYPSRTPNLTPRTVPACPANASLVVFQPGWYSSATAMNTLFNTCKDRDFWFQPGAYYFDFRDTSGGTQCRPGSATAADALHEWCIGPFADSKSVVIGGTPPAGWVQSPGNANATLNTFGFGGSTPQTWASQANMTSIDGNYGTYSWTSSDTSDSYGGAIYPSPGIPTNATGVVSVSADVVSQISAGSADRTLYVLYGNPANFYSLSFCGTYPITANTQTITGLESCFNTPDKLNTAILAIGANPTSNSGTVRLDGFRLNVTYTPSPARLPFPNGCDPAASGVQWIFGGDSRIYASDGSLELCAGPNPNGSPTNQQIAVYGVPPTPPLRPNANSTVAGQTATTITAGSNAQKIGEQGGIANATINFTPKCIANGGTIACNGSGTAASTTAYGSMRLTFPSGQFTLPANTMLQRVEMRASYNTFAAAVGSNPAPQFVITQNADGSGWSCAADATMPGTNQTYAFLRPVASSCLTAARLNAGFTVEWRATKPAVTCTAFNCGAAAPAQTLDGLEVIVTLDPTTAATAVVMPEDGCVSPIPNDYTAGQPLTYRYGPNAWEGDSAPDCALLKWDSVPRTSGTSSEIGCYSGQVSLQGTLYAPGAAIDLDQAGPKAAACNPSSSPQKTASNYSAWTYPIFNRGAIVRTLRIKGMFNAGNAAPPAIGGCGAATCGGVVQDRVVTFQARINGTTKIAARVRYPAAGGPAKVETWTVT